MEFLIIGQVQYLIIGSPSIVSGTPPPVGRTETTQFPRSASSLARHRLIVLVTRQQRPDNPGIFVGHRHGRAVFAAPFEQLPHPLAASVCLEPNPAQRHPCPVDEQFAHIAVTTFADAQQALLPASGMLAWYEPQPSSKLATVLERAGIADGGHKGRRT